MKVRDMEPGIPFKLGDCETIFIRNHSLRMVYIKGVEDMECINTHEVLGREHTVVCYQLDEADTWLLDENLEVHTHYPVAKWVLGPEASVE